MNDLASAILDVIKTGIAFVAAVSRLITIIEALATLRTPP